jgi:LmbE family N-acetylglucosaminyl deacetylase
MRFSAAEATGVLRWLGVLGGRARLERDVVVVSPHVDDAVFSLGAALSRAARCGAQVTVLTVLAGDVNSPRPAGEWDRRAGFGTAGEAARARRAEDERACALIGARPLWLPYSDLQYERGASDSQIREAVADAVGSGPVLLPSFPLSNPDHRWLRGLLEGMFPPERVGHYVEQPYAALLSTRPDDGPTAERLPDPASWRRLRASLSDERRKLIACRAYTSQLRLLGPIVGAIFRYEMRVGGEAAAWPDSEPDAFGA